MTYLAAKCMSCSMVILKSTGIFIVGVRTSSILVAEFELDDSRDPLAAHHTTPSTAIQANPRREPAGRISKTLFEVNKGFSLNFSAGDIENAIAGTKFNSFKIEKSGGEENKQKEMNGGIDISHESRTAARSCMYGMHKILIQMLFISQLRSCVEV